MKKENQSAEQPRTPSAGLSAFQERRKRGTFDSADYASADGGLVTAAINAVASRGGAVRFGFTRDGGAYAIGVYMDGDSFTDYVKPSEDIDEYLRQFIDTWAEVPK